MKLNPTRWLGYIKIGPRLALSYTLILLLMAATMVFTGNALEVADKNTASILEDNIVKIGIAEQMADSVHTLSRAMRTLLLQKSGDTAANAFEFAKLAAAKKQYDEAYKLVMTLPQDDEDEKLLARIEADKLKARPMNDQIQALIQEGKRDEALGLLMNQSRPIVNDWQDALASFSKNQKESAAADREEIAQNLKATVATSIKIAGTILLLSALLAYLITRSITEPLRELHRVFDDVRQGGKLGVLANTEGRDEMAEMGAAVNKVLQDQLAGRAKAEEDKRKAEEDKKKAEDENEKLNNSVIAILQIVYKISQKDLTVRVPVSQDILGTVADSINQMTDATSSILHGVNNIANQVSQASSKLQVQGEMVSKTAEEERKSVGEMIESLNEASQNMNQVAALVEQSNRSAERATQATDTALETVNSTVKGMESIRETIAETEKRIKRLGERSQEISGIVNLINTISERTHVLALNASMQAAVAGEAGRGFAVVAEEVQRLAESSRNATQQISTLVNNIQLETNETISTVNRTIGQVVQGSEFAQKAGEQMRITQAITGELVEQVRRITEASNEQKGMSAKLLLSVQHLGESNERTAEQIDTQSQETQTLLNSAQQLVESVKVFTLPKLA